VTVEFLAADVGRDIIAGGGSGTITGYTDAQHVTVTINTPFDDSAYDSGGWTILGTPQTQCTPSAASPVGASCTLTLTLAGWRVEDVGKRVSINGGLVRITGYSSNLAVSGVIEQELSATVGAPAFAWTLQGSMWGGSYGWPRCGTLYQQRLWLAGSPAFPQMVWGSVIGEYLNFQIGVLDDEALAYALASGELNPILHLSEASGLIALTYGGAFSIRGGSDKPITPTNIQVMEQPNFGCSRVAPERVGSEICYAQRTGRKVRAISPNEFNNDQYTSPDITVIAEHVTESGIVDMAYQQEPWSLLHACRDDGQVASLTLDRDQDVIAWARQTTQGEFESVESLPTPDGDALFAVVARVINGNLTRYIERADPALLTDCALTGTSDTGATVWTGLGHLEGRTVNVKADGVVLADQVVTAGKITIERPAFEIEIGLNYITTVVTLTPDLAGPVGSSSGSAYSIHSAIVRLLETIGCTVNFQELPFRRLGNEVLDQAPEPFTGDMPAGNLGWNDGQAQVIVQQKLPYPMQLLAVVSKLSVNDG
jgi:hypothetical protein